MSIIICLIPLLAVFLLWIDFKLYYIWIENEKKKIALLKKKEQLKRKNIIELKWPNDIPHLPF